MARQGRRQQVVLDKRVARSVTGENVGVKLTVADRDTGEIRKKTLLNPHGKGRKFARELKDGVHYTNAGQRKTNQKTGEVRKLTKVERSYRSGYLDAQKDSARAYKANRQRKG